MEYLLGSREDFFKFLKNMGVSDRVAILTHTDLDGLASAVFLEEILKIKNLKVDLIDFLDYKKELLEEELFKLKDKEINKVFICDLGVDDMDLNHFNKLREDFEIFLIDHHPINSELINRGDVIKTSSEDCSALTIFDFGKEILDTEKWNWLVCAAIFADYSYIKSENLKFIQERYPAVTIENIASSTPGINARKIADALIYYSDDKKKVYELVVNRDINGLGEVYEIIEEEINREVKEYFENAEYFPEKKIYIFKIDSKFNIASTVTTIVSKFKKAIFLSVMEISNQGMIKISARDQTGGGNVGELMKKGIQDLENAVGGGHKKAAAARINKKDFYKFKENILKN
jgi:single-stranded DNA-specific DHH superfamily exonuclease